MTHKPGGEPDKGAEDISDEIVRRKRLDNLNDTIKIQCSHGNWNYDEYMLGLTNGLLLAEAIILNKEYNPLSKPKDGFIREKIPNDFNPTVVSAELSKPDEDVRG